MTISIYVTQSIRDDSCHTWCYHLIHVLTLYIHLVTFNGMNYDWNQEKNDALKRDRDISFERILVAIEQGGLLDILEHHNPEKYGGQRLLVVDIDGYCWIVPFRDEVDQDRRMLITAFPSRKLTKHYFP